MRESDIVVSLVMETRDEMKGMQAASDLLCDLTISHEVVVMSNYTQEQVMEFVRTAQIRGVKVIIASGESESFVQSVVTNTLVPVLKVRKAEPGPNESCPLPGLERQLAFLSDTPTSGPMGAALTAAAIVGLNDCWASENLRKWRDSRIIPAPQ